MEPRRRIPMKATTGRCVFPGLLMLMLACTASAFYDPSLSRWINRDPIGDEVFMHQNASAPSSLAKILLRYESLGNPYQFVHNHPSNGIDPNGQNEIAIGTGVGGALVGIGMCLSWPPCREALERSTKPLLDALRDALSKCRPRVK